MFREMIVEKFLLYAFSRYEKEKYGSQRGYGANCINEAIMAEVQTSWLRILETVMYDTNEHVTL